MNINFKRKLFLIFLCLWISNISYALTYLEPGVYEVAGKIVKINKRYSFILNFGTLEEFIIQCDSNQNFKSFEKQEGSNAVLQIKILNKITRHTFQAKCIRFIRYMKPYEELPYYSTFKSIRKN